MIRKPGLPSVCIVTGEAVGLATGGIGTSMTGLAEALARAGYPVTLLYTRGFWMTRAAQERARERFKTQSIDFVPLPLDLVRRVSGPFGRLDYPVPVAVHDWLRAREAAGASFDIIHGNDTDADCVLALAARRAGLAFQETLFCTAVHSPRAWVQDLNDHTIMLPVSVIMDEAERAVIRDADMVWSPSRYMLDWIAARGFPAPRATVVQPYVLPRASLPPRMAEAPSSSLQSLVFFGRQERRKGLLIFLEAVRELAPELKRLGIDIVILGPSTRIDDRPSGDVIAELLNDIGVRWRIEAGKSQPEALAFLAQPGKLAILASPEDNSPCTVYEVLESGIPFIAAHGGGIPELLKDPTICIEPTSVALAAALRGALASHPSLPAPKRSQDQLASEWIAAHGWDGWLRTQTRATPHASAAAPLAIMGSPASAIALNAIELKVSTPWPSGHDVLLVDPAITVDPGAILAMRERLSGQHAIWQASTVHKGRREDATGSLLDGLANGLAPTGVLFIPAAARESIASEADLEIALLSGRIPLRPYPQSVGTRSQDLRPVPVPFARIARFGATPQRHIRDGALILAAIGRLTAPRLERRSRVMRVLRSPLGALLPYLLAWLGRSP
jgi:glycosyltransferase involved in cell wall biosynthesis